MFGIKIPDVPAREAPHPHYSESFSLSLLWGLQRKPVWAGDERPHVTAKRRAKNRVARASRRTNRAR